MHQASRDLVAAILLFFTLGCASNAKVSSGPALWSLGDKDTTVYLFGTVHILKPDTLWRLPHVSAAWEAADTVYFEADTEGPEVQEQVSALISKTGIYTDGRSLLSVLNEDQQRAVSRAAEHLGIPLQAVTSLKPWMAGLQLSVLQMVQAGYEPESGVEMVLSNDPLARSKQRGYFETAEQQIHLMGSLPEADQIAMLVSGATAVVDDPEVLDRMVSAWASGDVAELASQLGSVEAFGTQVVYDTLLTRRNRTWIPEITALLDQPGVKFVAVGAGHLVGKDSVIAMLEADGYRIRRR